MKDTDLKRTHLALKRELPSGMILLEKVGPVYFAFGEDALVASGILGLHVWTYCKGWKGVPTVNFQESRVDTFLAKIIRVGKSVAISEHIAEGSRAVTRVITP